MRKRRDDRQERGSSPEDPDRDAILARQSKLIAVALAGLTSAACGGDDGAPDAGMDASPVPCLSFIRDSGPLIRDSGMDAGESDAGDPDASIDAGESDAGELDGAGPDGAAA